MRRLFAAALAAVLAAAPLAAQKPGADDSADPLRESWRGQGISRCVAELGPAEGLAAEHLERICGCAFERYMAGRATDALPAIEPQLIRTFLARELLTCTAERQPDLAPSVARRIADATQAAAQASATQPPPLADAPAPAATGKPGEETARPGDGLGAWFDGLALPRWLSAPGLPLWAWVPLVVLVFLFLRGLLRRRSGHADLTGPPRR